GVLRGWLGVFKQKAVWGGMATCVAHRSPHSSEAVLACQNTCAKAHHKLHQTDVGCQFSTVSRSKFTCLKGFYDVGSHGSDDWSGAFSKFSGLKQCENAIVCAVFPLDR
ncbi:hypothetical protein, partial [Mesorhizobium sp.]